MMSGLHAYQQELSARYITNLPDHTFWQFFCGAACEAHMLQCGLFNVS